MSDYERAIRRLESHIEIYDIRIRNGHGTPEIMDMKQDYEIAFEALRRAQTDNEPLTCEGCVDWDADEDEVHCRECSRLIRVTDCYRRKSKQEGSAG